MQINRNPDAEKTGYGACQVFSEKNVSVSIGHTNRGTPIPVIIISFNDLDVQLLGDTKMAQEWAKKPQLETAWKILLKNLTTSNLRVILVHVRRTSRLEGRESLRQDFAATVENLFSYLLTGNAGLADLTFTK